MRSVVFFATGILIGSAIHGADAQSARAPISLNHVAISVPDLDEGIAFYTKALISRDTFLELQPASADRPVGFIHIGLEVADLAGAAGRFRSAGLNVRNPVVSERTKAFISQATGPGGLRMELLEFGPESLQRRVINAWKDASR